MRDEGLVAHVLELLEPFGDVRARRMFGGWGLYRDEQFFALIWRDALYLKVDDATRPGFVAAGCAPFTPPRRGQSVSQSYYQAPEEALDSAEALHPWAVGALAAAGRSKAAKTRKTSRKNRRGPLAR